MKRLILMRHAKTEPWIEGIDDSARALTPRGHEAAIAIRDAVADMGLFPDIALVSTARRTRETWAHLAQSFAECKLLLSDDLYLASERMIADEISDQADTDTLLVIGHNPGIHALAISLANKGGSRDHQAAMRLPTKMPTGAVAIFEVGDTGDLMLSRFLTPKDLGY